MKSIFGILLLILATMVFVIVVFANAVNDGNSVKEDAYESAKEIANESAGMVKFNDFYMYRGNEAWDVIVGEDSEGNEIGVWIPVESSTDEETTKEEVTTDEDAALQEEEVATEEEAATEEGVPTGEETVAEEDQQIEGSPSQGYILPMDGYITEQEAIEVATDGKDVKEVVAVNLGMENEVVIWEVTCINSKDNYSYYYVNAETSELVKSYENI